MIPSKSYSIKNPVDTIMRRSDSISVRVKKEIWEIEAWFGGSVRVFPISTNDAQIAADALESHGRFIGAHLLRVI